jgi:DNA-binding Xre family transcriptional regulator
MIPGIEEHARQLHAAMLTELRAAIRTARVPRIELARVAGVSTVTMQRRLTGTGRPFLFSELLAICPLLGVSVAELSERAERAIEATGS